MWTGKLGFIAKAIVPVSVAGVVLTQASTTALSQEATGAIEGRITFGGSPPAPLFVPESGGSQPVLYVDRSGGLRYAVIYLADALPTRRPVRPTATMTQRNFVFEPQVLAIRAGATVKFTNDDSANHNVRVRDADPTNTFSLNTAPGSAVPNTHRFAATEGRPLQLSCDIHPWMTAWIFVFDHDAFAVSGADGTFRIDHVPEGRHRMIVRQPSARLTRDGVVDVQPNKTARLDVRFSTADIGMPSR